MSSFPDMGPPTSIGRQVMIDLSKTEAQESILELRAGKPTHLCRQKTQENIRMQEHKTIGNYSIVDSTEVLD